MQLAMAQVVARHVSNVTRGFKDALLFPDDAEVVQMELQRMQSRPPKGPTAGQEWMVAHMAIAEKRFLNGLDHET